MKRIVLIRHAKSSWSDPALDDVERPLNKRGRLASPLMGAWLVELGITPDIVWLSPSTRTRETWRRMRETAGGPEGQVHKALYMADPDTMLNILRSSGDGDTVALVGHQPGMGAMARKLSNGKISTTCARAFNHYPSAAVAVLEAEVGKWSGVKFGGCSFKHFAAPKDLV
ncbi:SixA phosphatase family protein [Pontivivens ytuae]|uniref:Histidine phosphatase family protein n=1 Tax=Pontivivens ytuae TaxID=2789856 RepID=A0A7S9LU86_9RHOB|nr:histidine phosphatase family protein [Pontivivens ytuae]QPH55256.1 histidine phosphatase family protein [Pontivivens ytuae]